MSTHACPVTGCAHQQLPRTLLMCKPHWQMVPRALQRQVNESWRAYIRAPSRESLIAYRLARETAIDAVTGPEMTIATKGIGRRIRAVRSLLSMTQAEFSGKLGVSRSFLSEVESNKSKPSIEILCGIAVNFSQINTRWLLTACGLPNDRAP
jgi:DNA-binding XRE family transcriptional regulator